MVLAAVDGPPAPRPQPPAAQKKAEEEWQARLGEAKKQPADGKTNPSGQIPRPPAPPNGQFAPRYRFAADDLYGPGGPSAKDIDQDGLGDCYYVATLGAYANQKPGLVKDAISYDPKKGTFTVTLYEKRSRVEMFPIPRPVFETREVHIEVTQQDIEDNIRRGGGSTVDNRPGTDGPIWPAVMETARAKMLDKDHSNGLDQGYKEIEGGHARDAMFTVSGRKGVDIVVLGTTAGDKLLPGEPLNDIVYDGVRGALDHGRAVTFDTTPIGKDDGLAESHVYTVEDIGKNDRGEIIVTLRNPWASNAVGEGKPDEGNPVITVKLKDLVASGGAFTTSREPKITS